MMPKTSVVATLAGIVYEDATKLGNDHKKYQLYGLEIQTTAILVIIITMIIGCFMIDFLGPRLLVCEIKLDHHNEEDTEYHMTIVMMIMVIILKRHMIQIP